MKKIFSIGILLVVLFGCKEKGPEGSEVEISTKFGNFTILLYDETPLHRDNFLKLVKDGFYQDLLFHRVIKDFMIQGGDPESKSAAQGVQLGSGGPGYTIPAEFNFPKYYHKRGALAAARQGDQTNPKKESSGSQFYIVQGKTFTVDELSKMALGRSDQKRQEIFYRILPQYQDTLQMVQNSGDPEKMKAIQDFIMAKVDEEFVKADVFSFTDEQIQTYTTIGGTPFLDGNYTVFGEVTQGMSVVDSIAKVMVDASNRPVEDIQMKVKVLK